VLTLRQLKDARLLFHNGAFTNVKDVVNYFNAGVPQDAQAGAAATLTTRFTRDLLTVPSRPGGAASDRRTDAERAVLVEQRCPVASRHGTRVRRRHGASACEPGSDGHEQEATYRITKNSASVIDTHLLIVVRGLSPKTRLLNATRVTSAGDPFVRVFLPDGVMQPGQGTTQRLVFRRSPGEPGASYSLSLLSGQGTP
jgi:hypothetical protein